MVALMDNWDDFLKNVDVAKASEGTLQRQQEIYAESWEAARDRIQSAIEGVYNSLINDQFFIDLDNQLTTVIQRVENVITALGGMSGVLVTVGTLMLNAFGDHIAQGLRDITYNISLLIGLERLRAIALKESVAALMDMLAGLTGSLAMALYTEIYKKQADLLIQANRAAKDLNAQLQELLKMEMQIVEFTARRAENYAKAALKAEDELDVLRAILNESKDLLNFENIKTRALTATINVKGEDVNAVEYLARSIKNLTIEELENSNTVDILISSYLLLKEQLGQLSTAEQNLTNAQNRLNTEMAKPEAERDALEIERLKLQVAECEKVVKDLGVAFGNVSTEELRTRLLAMGVVFNNVYQASDEFKDGLEKAGHAATETGVNLERSAEGVRLLGVKADEAKSKIEGMKGTFSDWADVVTSAAGALMNLMTILRGVNAILKAFTDKDLTTAERFTLIITGLTMILPAALSLTSFLAKTIKTLSIERAADAVATGALTVAQEAHNVAMGVGVALQAKLMIGLAAVVAAVVIASAIINKLSEAYHKASIEAKEASDRAKEFAEESSKAAQKAKEIKTVFDEYNSLVDTLEDCTGETQRWAEALQAVKDKALEILEKYPELAKVPGLFEYTPEGVMLNQDKMAEVLAEYERQAYNALSAAAAANIDVVNKQIEAIRVDADRAVPEKVVVQLVTGLDGGKFYQTGERAIGIDPIYGEVENIRATIFNNLEQINKDIQNVGFSEAMRRAFADVKNVFRDTASFDAFIEELKKSLAEITNLARCAADGETQINNYAMAVVGSNKEIQDLKLSQEEFNIVVGNYADTLAKTKDELMTLMDTDANAAKKLFDLYVASLPVAEQERYRYEGKDSDGGIKYSLDGEVLTLNKEDLAAKVAGIRALEKLAESAEKTSEALDSIELKSGNKEIATGIAGLSKNGNFNNMSRSAFDEMLEGLKEKGGAYSYLMDLLGVNSEAEFEAKAKDLGWGSGEELVRGFVAGIAETADKQGDQTIDKLITGPLANASANTYPEIELAIDKIRDRFGQGGDESGDLFVRLFNDTMNNMLDKIAPEKLNDFINRFLNIDWTKAEAIQQAENLLTAFGLSADEAGEHFYSMALTMQEAYLPDFSEQVSGLNIYTEAIGEAKIAAFNAIDELSQKGAMSDDVEKMFHEVLGGMEELANFDLMPIIEKVQAISEAYKHIIDPEYLKRLYLEALTLTKTALADIKKQIDDTLKKIKPLELAVKSGGIPGEERLKIEKELTKLRKDLKKYTELEFNAQLNTKDLERAIEAIEGLELDPLKVQLLVEDAEIEKIKGIADTITQAGNLIDDKLQVTSDNVVQLANLLPEVFDLATVDIETGIVTLEQGVVEATQAGYLALILSETAAMQEILRVRADEAQRELTIVKGVADGTISESSRSATLLKTDHSEVSAKAKEAAAVILKHYGTSYIQSKNSSKSSSSVLTQAQNAVANASAEDAPIMAENWTNAFNAVLMAANETLSQVAKMQDDVANEKEVRGYSLASTKVSTRTANYKFNVSDSGSISEADADAIAYLNNGFDANKIISSHDTNSAYWNSDSISSGLPVGSGSFLISDNKVNALNRTDRTITLSQAKKAESQSNARLTAMTAVINDAFPGFNFTKEDIIGGLDALAPKFWEGWNAAPEPWKNDVINTVGDITLSNFVDAIKKLSLLGGGLGESGSGLYNPSSSKSSGGGKKKSSGSKGSSKKPSTSSGGSTADTEPKATTSKSSGSSGGSTGSGSSNDTSSSTDTTTETTTELIEPKYIEPYTIKELDDSLEKLVGRYEDINTELKRHKRIVSDLGDTIERSWGLDKADLLFQKAHELEKEVEDIDEKLKQSGDYITEDKAKMYEAIYGGDPLGPLADVVQGEFETAEHYLNRVIEAVEGYEFEVDNAPNSEDLYGLLTISDGEVEAARAAGKEIVNEVLPDFFKMLKDDFGFSEEDLVNGKNTIFNNEEMWEAFLKKAKELGVYDAELLKYLDPLKILSMTTMELIGNWVIEPLQRFLYDNMKIDLSAYDKYVTERILGIDTRKYEIEAEAKRRRDAQKASSSGGGSNDYDYELNKKYEEIIVESGDYWAKRVGYDIYTNANYNQILAWAELDAGWKKVLDAVETMGNHQFVEASGTNNYYRDNLEVPFVVDAESGLSVTNLLHGIEYSDMPRQELGPGPITWVAPFDSDDKSLGAVLTGLPLATGNYILVSTPHELSWRPALRRTLAEMETDGYAERWEELNRKNVLAARQEQEKQKQEAAALEEIKGYWFKLTSSKAAGKLFDKNYIDVDKETGQAKYVEILGHRYPATWVNGALNFFNRMFGLGYDNDKNISHTGMYDDSSGVIEYKSDGPGTVNFMIAGTGSYTTGTTYYGIPGQQGSTVEGAGTSVTVENSAKGYAVRQVTVRGSDGKDYTDEFIEHANDPDYLINMVQEHGIEFSNAELGTTTYANGQAVSRDKDGNLVGVNNSSHAFEQFWVADVDQLSDAALKTFAGIWLDVFDGWVPSIEEWEAKYPDVNFNWDKRRNYLDPVFEELLPQYQSMSKETFQALVKLDFEDLSDEEKEDMFGTSKITAEELFGNQSLESLISESQITATLLANTADLNDAKNARKYLMVESLSGIMNEYGTDALNALIHKDYDTAVKYNEEGKISNKEELYGMIDKQAEEEIQRILGRQQGNEFMLYYNEYQKAVEAAANGTDEHAEDKAAAAKAKMDELSAGYQDQIKKIIQARDDLKQAIDDYNDALEDALNLEQQRLLAVRDIADTYLEAYRTIFQFNVEARKSRLHMIELTKKIDEAVGGNFLQTGYNSMILDFSYMQESEKLIDNYKNRFVELMSIREGIDETNMADWVDDMKELSENIEGTIDDIVTWVEAVREYVPNAVSAYSDEMDKVFNRLEHFRTLLTSMKDILTILNFFSSDISGINRNFEIQQSALRTTYQSNLDLALMNKKTVEALTVERDKFVEVMKLSKEGTVAYNDAKLAKEAIEAQLQEAEEAMYASSKAAMDTAGLMFTESVENTRQNLEYILTNNQGFSNAQTHFDNYIDEEGRYLDTVNRIYETTRLNNLLQKSLDETTNAAYAKRLEALKAEFQQIQSNNKLSLFDIQVMEKKLELAEKELALEDARDNKTELRLVRNAQGNWNYLYTANLDDAKDAEADYLKSVDEWYNISKDKAKEMSAEILATEQEMTAKLAEIANDRYMDLTQKDAAYQEAYTYYTLKLNDLDEERTKAIGYMTEAGNLAIDEFRRTHEDDMNAMGGDVNNLRDIYSSDLVQILSNTDEFHNEFGHLMELNAGLVNGFKEKTGEAIVKLLQHNNDYKSNVEEVTDAVGLDYDDLTEKINEVTKAEESLTTATLIAQQAMIDSLVTIDEQTLRYIKLGDAILYATRLLQAWNKEVQNKIYDTDDYGGIDSDRDYSRMMAKLVANADDKEAAIKSLDYLRLKALRELKIKDNDMKEEDYILNGDAFDLLLLSGGTYKKGKYQDWYNNLLSGYSDAQYRSDMYSEGLPVAETAPDLSALMAMYILKGGKVGDAVYKQLKAQREKKIDANPNIGFVYRGDEFDEILRNPGRVSTEKQDYLQDNLLKRYTDADYNKYLAIALGEKNYSDSSTGSVLSYKTADSNVDISALIYGLAYYIMKNGGSYGDFVGTPFYEKLANERQLKIDLNNLKKGEDYTFDGWELKDYLNRIMSGEEDEVGDFTRYKLNMLSLSLIKEYLETLGAYSFLPTSLKNLLGFDTGGYTGDFEGGKLAILHEKELVLNKEDTENILNAVTAVRSMITPDIGSAIASAVTLGVASLLERFTAMPNFSALGSQELQQNVHIEASFPGVRDASEIELALSNLVNDAVQYTGVGGGDGY